MSKSLCIQKPSKHPTSNSNQQGPLLVFLKNTFYLFGAALHLCGCMQMRCTGISQQWLPLLWSRGRRALRLSGSATASPGFLELWLSSCAQAWLLWGMWGLPGPEITLCPLHWQWILNHWTTREVWPSHVFRKEGAFLSKDCARKMKLSICDWRKRQVTKWPHPSIPEFYHNDW